MKVYFLFTVLESAGAKRNLGIPKAEPSKNMRAFVNEKNRKKKKREEKKRKRNGTAEEG